MLSTKVTRQITTSTYSMTDGGTGDGLPREIFSWPVESWTRTPEAEEKVEELIRGYRGYRRDLER